MAELVQRAGDGLRRIFSHCEGFTPGSDLLTWMKARNVSPATIYVNWIGRTAQQVREEEALRQALEKFIQENPVHSARCRRARFTTHCGNSLPPSNKRGASRLRLRSQLR